MFLQMQGFNRKKNKKNRESLCRQLTDGKAFAVGGLTAKEDTWQLTVKSGNSGTTKCPRLSALPSAGPWLTAKGGPHVALIAAPLTSMAHKQQLCRQLDSS